MNKYMKIIITTFTDKMLKKVLYGSIIEILIPVLQMFNIMGVMPITYNSNTGNLTYDLVSLKTLYSAIWYCFIPSGSVIILYRVITHNPQFFSIFYFLYELSFLTFQTVLLLCVLYSCDTIIYLTDSLDSYHYHYKNCKYLKDMKNNSRMHWIFMLSIYFSIWISLTLYYIFNKKMSITGSIIKIISWEYLLRNKFYIFISYLIFCQEIINGYSNLILQISAFSGETSRIITLRLLLTKLHNCTQVLQNIYGPIWFVCVIHTSYSLICQLALYIANNFSHVNLIGEQFTIAVQAWYLLPLTVISHQLMNQRDLALKEIHIAFDNHNDKNLMFQEIVLLKQLRIQPARISCFGIFTINIPFLVSFLNGMATMIIAVYQLEPQFTNLFNIISK